MLKFGLIGCGRISGKHIAAVAHNVDIMKLAVLCDTDERKANKRAEELSSLTGDTSAEIYTDYEKMLQYAKLDAVCIATDSGSHFEIAMRCLESGLHTLVEKPMAMTAEECQKMIDMAAQKGVLLGACHQNRFNPSIQALRKALGEGRLGKIYSGSVCILWNRDKAYYDEASWRGTRARDGGCLMNQCIHGIDALLWLMGGKPVKISAITRNFFHPYIEMEDYGNIRLEFDNGAVATIEGTVNVYDRNLKEELTILGQNGTVVIGGTAMNTIEEWRVSGSSENPREIMESCAQDVDSVYGYGHIPLYSNFTKAILGSEALLVDGKEGMKVVELVSSIYSSAESEN